MKDEEMHKLVNDLTNTELKQLIEIAENELRYSEVAISEGMEERK